jgi:hypothetical protein
MKQYSKVTKEQFQEWKQLSKDLGFFEKLKDLVRAQQHQWSKGGLDEATNDKAIGRCLSYQYILGLTYREFINQVIDEDRYDDNEELREEA